MAKKHKLGKSFTEARQSKKVQTQAITAVVLGGFGLVATGGLSALFLAGAGYKAYETYKTASSDPHKKPGM